MRTWRVPAGARIDGLRLAEEASAPLAPGQVRLRVKAASLNYRDLAIMQGWYPTMSQGPLVPGSDAVGEVVEIGPGVTRLAVGDRAATIFFPNWIDGAMRPERTAGALGGGGLGTLAEELVISGEALVKSPAHLTDPQAATLTCAGVTAWRALFETGAMRAGNTILLLGTGGVSIWALQLAKAAGARVIITSSSDAKLEQARALGADETINYTRVPEWGPEVRRLTGGEGVDLVVEVGGEKTVVQSLGALRMEGTMIIVGSVSGTAGGIPPRALIPGAIRVQGVYVGSRRMHEDLARFVTQKKLQPVVDKAFAFAEAPDAYRYFEAGKHFGKVAIALT